MPRVRQDHQVKVPVCLDQRASADLGARGAVKVAVVEHGGGGGGGAYPSDPVGEAAVFEVLVECVEKGLGAPVGAHAVYCNDDEARVCDVPDAAMGFKFFFGV